MSKIFCPEPFTYCEINPNGDVFVCCDTWCNNYAIGNLFEESLYEIWNSFGKGKKNIFIKQFENQKFDYCNTDVCLHRQQLNDEDFEKIYIVHKNENKLKRLRLNFDFTCNIKCVFCRDTYLSVTKEEEPEITKIYNQIIKTLPYLNECHTTMSFCGVGEFFCSKIHTNLIKNIVSDYPNIKFSFVSNGILCSEENLKNLNVQDKIEGIEISVNAYNETTYNKICIGGDFKKVRENLQYLSKLKKEQKIELFFMNFVITAENYREMPDFAKWAMDLGAIPQFLTLMSFGNYINDEIFDRLNVLNPNHSQHNEFLKIIREPVFKNKNVNIPQNYINM